MTEDEMVGSLLRDIKFAHRLGCTIIRVIVDTPAEVMARCAGYAEQYNVKLGLEIHAPSHFDAPLIQNQLEMMERVGSPYLGVIPDFGIFVRRLPRILTERWKRDAARQSQAGREHPEDGRDAKGLNQRPLQPLSTTLSGRELLLPIANGMGISLQCLGYLGG